MKKFTFFLFFLCFIGGAFQLSQAQLSNCDICQTQVNTIQQFDFDSGSGFSSIGFQATVSGSSFCQVLGYEWSTNYPGAVITPVDEWARIDFPMIGPSPGPGGILGSNIYQVCLTYSQWLDRNGNGVTESNEICENTLCITVRL